MSIPTLKRCFGLRESLTITVGTVIGVGLFTVGANTVGDLGPGVILATLTALGISIYPALLYAEMSAALPLSGGTYQYAAIGLGRPAGMLAGLNFVVSMVAVASGEALAFSFYLRTLLEALGIGLPFPDAVLACLAIAGFVWLGVRGVEMTGRMQNGFMFFFWGVAVVWLLSLLPKLRFASFAGGLTLGGITEFLPGVAMIWWCFAGFETCCAMGEEIKFPQITLPRALFLAPFLVFAVNGLFQWALLCLVPPQGLAALSEAAAPYALGMQQAGIVGFPLILLCAGIAFGGDFSTLNAAVSAPARYLYSMARDGALPQWLGRIHPRFQTPYAAVLVLGGLMLVLVGTGSIGLIASLSLFATLFYYIIGIVAACALRRRYPRLSRPFRAPGIRIGAPVSILIYGVMLLSLERAALWAGAVWCAAGLAYYALFGKKRMAARSPEILKLQRPTKPEEEAMDREFVRWRAAVFAAVGLVLLLYVIAFFH